jgi:Mg/Co/Ni transporter MgtE
VVGKLLAPEIKSLIDARDFGALREIFREWPPADVADVILDLPEDEQVIIFRVLPHALAADVFEYLDVDAQQKLLRAMAHEQVVALLNEMPPDDRTALLEELPSAAVPVNPIADAGGTADRAIVAWLSGRQRRTSDDAGFYRGEHLLPHSSLPLSM